MEKQRLASLDILRGADLFLLLAAALLFVCFRPRGQLVGVAALLTLLLALLYRQQIFLKV